MCGPCGPPEITKIHLGNFKNLETVSEKLRTMPNSLLHREMFPHGPISLRRFSEMFLFLKNQLEPVRVIGEWVCGSSHVII